MFTVSDKNGIPVTLSKEVWTNKIMDIRRGHPEVGDYLTEIKSTIEDPDFIFQSIRDDRSRLFYKKGLTTGKYRDCYILVVAKYVKEKKGVHGYVSTIMLTTHIKKGGGLLWKK